MNLTTAGTPRTVELMTTLVKEDPATDHRVAPKYVEALAVLKQSPGEWFLVSASTDTNETIKWCYLALQRRQCEVTRRSTPEGLFKVYAKWG